ncbi:MAG: response regulator transcription factor [Segetibacter sp.]
MKPIFIAIADDHPLVLNGLKTVLSQFGNRFQLLWEAVNGKEILQNLESLPEPDVLLLDIQMPGRDGMEMCKIIHQQYPAIHIIALTNFEDVFYVKNMIKNGAQGYLLKTADIEVLLKAIETVYKGEEFFDEAIKSKLIQDSLFGKRRTGLTPMLTRREKEVLKFIIDEFTNPQIADKLFLSLRTVEKHRTSLLQKLGVKNTAGLVKEAITKGLVDL